MSRVLLLGVILVLSQGCVGHARLSRFRWKFEGRLVREIARLELAAHRSGELSDGFRSAEMAYPCAFCAFSRLIRLRNLLTFDLFGFFANHGSDGLE